MSDQPQSRPPEYVPPSQMDPTDLMKAFEAEGIVEPKPAEPAPAPAAAKPSIEAPPAKTDEPPALLKIAKERAALRQERERVEPYLEAFKAIPPHTAQALAKAVQSGNAVAVLSALGMTHSQYTQQLLGMKNDEQPEAKSEPKSEYATLKAELDALKAERDAERVRETRTQYLSKMKETLKDDPKFKLTNGREDYEGVERILINYHAQHGVLPGETLEESIKLAAEVYEQQLSKEAEKWSKVLTVSPNTAPLSVQKAPESPPSTGTVSPRTLTNANTTAPAAVQATVQKTRDELLEDLLAGRIDLDAL